MHAHTHTHTHTHTHSLQIGVVYNDHSFYLWDLSNIKQIGKTHSSLYHSACVWDICVSCFCYNSVTVGVLYCMVSNFSDS